MSEYSLEIHASVAQLPIIADNLSDSERNMVSSIYNSSNPNEVRATVEELVAQCIRAIKGKVDQERITGYTRRKILRIVIRGGRKSKTILLSGDKGEFDLRNN